MEEILNNLKEENKLLTNTLFSLVAESRKIMKPILMCGGRPVKGTTKKEAYEALELLQYLYATNYIYSNEDAFNLILEKAKIGMEGELK